MRPVLIIHQKTANCTHMAHMAQKSVYKKQLNMLHRFFKVGSVSLDDIFAHCCYYFMQLHDVVTWKAL